jgi:CRISPR/Cas system-associated exonuclease Cas4 (RecB family)
MDGQEDSRLVSASEVERYCYCPVSWRLDRESGPTSDRNTIRGDRAHATLSRSASGVMDAQKRASEAKTSAFAFVLISVFMLALGVSIAFLTTVGFIDTFTWRIAVLSISLILVSVGLFIYFRSSAKDTSVIRTIIAGSDMKDVKRRVGFTLGPFLFFLFGLYLLVNGILMLRPFGLSVSTFVSIMTVSLLGLYLFLLAFTLIFLRSPEERLLPGRITLTNGLMVGLLLSLTVLFLLVSEVYGIGDVFGFMFLIGSFVWFIGSLVFHLIRQWSLGSRKSRSEGSSDLSMAVLSTIASLFATSAFMSTGRWADRYYVISIVLALFWLLGAAFFIKRGATLSKAVDKGVSEIGLPRGSRILSRDSPKGMDRGRALISRKHFLIGTPDLIIAEGGKMVPLEFKSGRIPPRPHFNHVMQLMCYMILLDANTGTAPPYGYIEYGAPGGERQRFKVDSDLMTRAIALSKVSEIRSAYRTGEAHRDHDRPGKCRNCAKFGICPERLT